MATIPQASKTGLSVDDEGSYILPPDHRRSGWTVDELLAEGKVEEARAELERLVLEGMDSGPAIEATPEFWERLRSRARGEINTER